MKPKENYVSRAELPMKDCVLTLQSNAKINVLYAEKGRGLLERIGREGMN